MVGCKKNKTAHSVLVRSQQMSFVLLDKNVPGKISGGKRLFVAKVVVLSRQEKVAISNVKSKVSHYHPFSIALFPSAVPRSQHQQGTKPQVQNSARPKHGHLTGGWSSKKKRGIRWSIDDIYFIYVI